MSTLLAPHYDFTADSASSLAISSSKVDEEFDDLIAAANQKVQIASAAPSSPVDGQTWVDSSIDPPLLKVRDATNSIWDIVARVVGKGADVASATATTLGDDGGFFDITGTTTITSITAKRAGTVVILQFDGILTLTDGSNLKLDGNFVTAAESVIALVCDGTNWWEIARQPLDITSGADYTRTKTGDWMISSVTTARTGWTNVSATYSDKFMRINATPLTTGGTDTHTHAGGSYA